MGLLIIPILAFLIIIHELGHFFAARSVGVEVEEFGIGIPPRARSWKWKGVLWSLNWIPFGGFVRVRGEDKADGSKGSMNSAGPLQRAWFLLAGPFMNLLAAVVLAIVIVGVQGTPTEVSPLYVASVQPGSPAEAAEWRPGDKIVAVNGKELTSQNDVVAAINGNAGSDVHVTIARGEKRIETVVTPRENPPAGQGATGIAFNDGRLSDVFVRDIEPGSSAAEAGIQKSDQIVAIDGIQIEALYHAVGIMNANQGEDVTVTVNRDGQTLDVTLSVPPPSMFVTEVASGTPASDALLYQGDRITAINGEQITSAASFLDSLNAAAGSEVELTYVREGNERTTTLSVPSFGPDKESINPLDDLGMGIAQPSPFGSAGMNVLGNIEYDDVPASRAIPEGWNYFWGIITGTVEAIRNMFSDGVRADQFTGPIGMGQLTSELLAETPEPTWVILTQLTILISISLGILNLLPLPALDGGRLLFVIIEILRGGKRIAPEKEGLVHLAGMVLLLGLMFYIAFGDVSRIIDGESILP